MRARSVIILVVALSALVVLVFGIRRQEKGLPAAVVGLEAPEPFLRDPSGKTLDPSELKGSVVLVNFWATWCQPCREEMPSLQNLYNRFRDKQGFHMVTVLFRDDYGKASAYLKENHYDIPVLIDTDGRTARAYGVTGVPETYLVDRKGILKEKMIGPFDWASPQALSLVSELMRQ